MTKFRKTKKLIKKNDVTITFIKSNTFINVLNVKSILNNSLSLIDNVNKKIDNVNKKIKFDSFMFDLIFNEFDEFFFKIKNNINDFQRQLDQFVQKIFKFKHKIQHCITLIRNLIFVFNTFTTNYFRVVDAISIAKSNVVNQTMKKLKKI